MKKEMLLALAISGFSSVNCAHTEEPKHISSIDKLAGDSEEIRDAIKSLIKELGGNSIGVQPEKKVMK